MRHKRGELLGHMAGNRPGTAVERNYASFDLGYPRALEALFAILSADRETSLQEILDDTEKLLPEFVVETYH